MGPFVHDYLLSNVIKHLKHAAAFWTSMAAALDEKLDDNFANVIELVKECNLKQVASLGECQGSNILTVRSVQQVS